MVVKFTGHLTGYDVLHKLKQNKSLANIYLIKNIAAIYLLH